MKIIIIYLSRRAGGCQVVARGSVEVDRAPTRSPRSASVEFLTRAGTVATNERLGAPPSMDGRRWYRSFMSRASRRARPFGRACSGSRWRTSVRLACHLNGSVRFGCTTYSAHSHTVDREMG